MKYTHVIWDWNGTLLDDVGWCVSVINGMLKRRGLKLLKGVPDYQRAFCFPIINLYKNLGVDFDKEPFEDVAHEYIPLYHSEKTGGCKLSACAEYVLEAIHQQGISQIILSASEINNLMSQINEFDIRHYFDAILGLSDIYAKSKIEIGLDYFKDEIKDALLVGDTEHDWETAKALGIDCLLVAIGHQSKDTLLACGAPIVLNNLAQVIEYIN